MVLPSQFKFQGCNFLVVTPADWMLNSKLIKDHVDRGDSFLVNLSTGTLSVATREMRAKIEESMEHLAPEVVASTAAGKTDVTYYRDKLRKLAADARAALGE